MLHYFADFLFLILVRGLSLLLVLFCGGGYLLLIGWKATAEVRSIVRSTTQPSANVIDDGNEKQSIELVHFFPLLKSDFICSHLTATTCTSCLMVSVER